MNLQTPAWVKHSIFYQIFPDRFSRSQYTKNITGVRLKDWGTAPEVEGFQGGDLYGIIERLDYLQDLNINALYLNPIFSSASNHRYHTYDYFQVDPLLGGNKALRYLLDECHQRNIKVVLDGVFNHCGRGFWPFHHILENGHESPYLDWFIIHGWPLRPYNSTEEHHHNYDSWWDLPALPKFNIKNKGVRKYLLSIAKYWVEFGIDGWRIDAAEQIKDNTFWQEFRQTVKAINPEAYICGEIWDIDSSWLKGDQFDGLMNYPLATSALGYFGGEKLRPSYFPDPNIHLERCDAEALALKINQLQKTYTWQANLSHLNILNSHDTARLPWVLGENRKAIQQCVLFQMTMPGIPCVYYGDEIGMSSPGIPSCREAFPWYNEKSWNQNLLQYYQDVTALRHRYTCFQTGDFRILHSNNDGFVFAREAHDEYALVGFNVGSKEISIDLNIKDLSNNKRDFSQIYGDESVTIIQAENLLHLEFPARTSIVLFNAI